jgi:hypothetical protein
MEDLALMRDEISSETADVGNVWLTFWLLLAVIGAAAWALLQFLEVVSFVATPSAILLGLIAAGTLCRLAVVRHWVSGALQAIVTPWW